MKDFDSTSIQSLEFKSESKEPIDPINRKEISELNQSDVSISKSASDFLHTDPYQGSDPAKRSSSTNHVGSSSSSKPSTIWNCFSNSQSKHNDNGDSSDDEKDENHPVNLRKSRSFVALKRKKSNLNQGKQRNHSEKSLEEDDPAKGDLKSSSKEKSKRKEVEEIRSKISELRSLGASTFLVPHSSNPDSFVEL